MVGVKIGTMINQSRIDAIIQLYTIDHLSYQDIMKRCHISQDAIHNILCDNNIHIRHISHRITIDVEELKQLYVVEHLPSTEIARRYGITSPTVLSKLREANIPIQPKHGNPFNKKRIKLNELPSLIQNPKIVKQQITGEVTCPICGKTRRLTLNRTRIKDIVKSNARCNPCAEKARARVIDLQPIKHLLGQQFTIKEISERLNLPSNTIRSHMKRSGLLLRNKTYTQKMMFKRKVKNNGTIQNPFLGDIRQGYEIGLRNPSYYMWVECQQCKGLRWETKSRVHKLPLCQPCAMIQNGLNHRGENAPGWLGGLSFEPYGIIFNKTLREQIRQRDNYTCQLCGTPQNGMKLACHHIDYNKKHNHSNNLISLCTRSCHLRTNHHREYWTAYFNELLIKRGIITQSTS